MSETNKKNEIVSNCIKPLDESWDSGADATIFVMVFSNFAFNG